MRSRRCAAVRRAGALWMAASACLLLSCGSGLLSQTRRHTYPPTFNYITDEQLQVTMWQLAAQVRALDDILSTGELPTPRERLQVLSILARMEEVSRALGPEDWPSNHPKVSRNVGRFRRDLAAARRAAEVDPPSFYLAGTISGACMHCHGDE